MFHVKSQVFSCLIAKVVTKRRKSLNFKRKIIQFRDFFFLVGSNYLLYLIKNNFFRFWYFFVLESWAASGRLQENVHVHFEELQKARSPGISQDSSFMCNYRFGWCFWICDFFFFFVANSRICLSGYIGVCQKLVFEICMLNKKLPFFTLN